MLISKSITSNQTTSKLGFFSVEKCWFIGGLNFKNFYIGKLYHHSDGTTLSVDFDWKMAVKNTVLGFYHTHIDGDPYLSNEDTTTMRTWVISEGRPMICGVMSGNSQACWLFYRKNKSIRYRRIRGFLFGNFFIAYKGDKNENS